MYNFYDKKYEKMFENISKSEIFLNN
jgi:hypothetical protein